MNNDNLLRGHRFLGTTQSLCPRCLAVVPAKILERDGRIYFRKHCVTHGLWDDFVCADSSWFDRLESTVPGRLPEHFGAEPNRGCPYDCGLCTEHEQHTCVAVLEITSSCNLTCPMCYAESSPGGKHLTFEQCCRAIDRLVFCEGRPEILQLSGGEPTVHPQFLRILDYACRQPIDIVMLNTNGIRIAQDESLRMEIAARKDRCQIYLQMDSLKPGPNQQLRGEPLEEIKLRAIELLGELDIRTTLVCTVQTDVNEDQIGPLVEFGLARPSITGVCFQPATYVGRYFLPDELERRVTFPDIIRAVVQQPNSIWQESDFLPVPCAHPNSHTMAYAFRTADQQVPLTRFMDVANQPELFANGITFTRQRAKTLIESFLARQACGDECNCGTNFVPLKMSTIGDGEPRRRADTPGASAPRTVSTLAQSFFTRAIAEDLSAADVFRITTTSFMDAYNFDVRQLIKSCVHHVLPSGHIIPFCAYNNLYRHGHLPLPPRVDRPSRSLVVIPSASVV